MDNISQVMSYIGELFSAIGVHGATIISLVSIFISISSYRFAKRSFDINANRLVYESAETHTLKILEMISEERSFKVKSKSELSKKQDRYIGKYLRDFEKKEGKFFTRLNVSCSAFTTTRKLTSEKYAYGNIGLEYCEFIKPYIGTLGEFSKMNPDKYSDIIRLYRLWDIRGRIDKSLDRQNEAGKKLKGEFVKYIKLISRMPNVLIRAIVYDLRYGDELRKEVKTSISELKDTGVLLLGTAKMHWMTKRETVGYHKRLQKIEKTFGPEKI